MLSAQPAGIILKKFCVYIDIHSSTIERVSRKHTGRDNIYYFVAAVLYNKALTNDFFIRLLRKSRTLYEIFLKNQNNFISLFSKRNFYKLYYFINLLNYLRIIAGSLRVAHVPGGQPRTH